MIGQTLAHYKILEKIGAGGMGDVYLAEDTTLRRRVAIKVISDDAAADERKHRRLVREAQAAAALDHPNICSVFEIGTDPSCPYIAMQYIKGETLAERLERGPLSIDESYKVVSQVADALVDAHAHGILHRDIKPQNIMLTEQGRVKVLDFGLAKLVVPEHSVTSTQETELALTEAGAVVGTAAYMSPEQLRAAPLDGRSDLFSLGAVFYECLTGEQAFRGQTWPELGAAILGSSPPPPSALHADASARDDEICMRLLSKSADDRYGSAAELLSELGERSDTRPRTLVERPKRRPGWSGVFARARQKPVVVAALASVVAAAVVVALVYVSGTAPPPPPEDAARWYARGVDSVQQSAYLTASRSLERAIEIHPEYPLAHARLAEAQYELDEIDRALQSMLRATQMVPDRSRLDRTDALYLDALSAMVSRDLARAVEDPNVAGLRVILNWTEELEHLVPTGN